MDLNVGLTLIYKVKKLIIAGSDLAHLHQSGRLRTVCEPRAAAGLLRRVKAAPNKSLRKVADEAGTSHTTVQRVVKKAGGKSLRLLKGPLVDA